MSMMLHLDSDYYMLQQQDASAGTFSRQAGNHLHAEHRSHGGHADRRQTTAYYATQDIRAHEC